MNLAKSLITTGTLALLACAGAQAATTQTYIVQLADAPAATYDGRVAGLRATRVTGGAKLDSSAAPVRNYVQYLNQRGAAELARVGAVPMLHSYGYAFNGFSAKLTEAQVTALRTSSAVKSITADVMRHIVTTRTPEFIGIAQPGGLWSKLDAAARNVKGENVIIGLIDTGIWPEDPSFADKVDASGKPVPYFGSGTLAYDAPPAKWKGSCQVGDGFTAAMCNNKLIGARYYIDGFLAPGYTLAANDFRSPRGAPGGSGGHGSHTASTAGGNGNVTASINGINAGVMSGVAPRARLAIYKACWTNTDDNTGCFPSDLLQAIDDAVKDGVDVISFSISGSQSYYDDVEIAFFNASAAGIFVAAAAGNDGPYQQVNHPSPWLTTVAASTHDRYTVASVSLGSGASFSGPSYQREGLPAKPLILSQNAGVKPFAALSATDQLALQRCYNPDDLASLGGTADAMLDPAKVAGRIVVCIRGANALVNKAAAVQAAGGLGLVIQNAPGTLNTTLNQPYVVPTVHLDASAYPAVSAYATAVNATASFGPGVQQANVVAPVMADFSSRGPSLLDLAILKPDLTAPGVDIIAAWTDDTLTQAQHDAVVANTYVPKSNATSIQGTSMATPHVAGAAALLKQLHPAWSPAAIKSALMTAATGVKLASGDPDPARFGYGAGHLSPNGAADPGLVYDITTTDYARFLCGQNVAPPAGIGTCATLGAITSDSLNLASLTAPNVVSTRVLTRTVTNVSNASGTYVSRVSLPGWGAVVQPTELRLAPGASATYTVTVNASGAPIGTWAFGSVVWFDGTHTVTSPLSAIRTGFNAPAEVSDVRASGRGTKVFQVKPTFDAQFSVAATGLVPATVSNATVATGAVDCRNATVPTGAQVVRFQLFDADLAANAGAAKPVNLDLDVFNGPNGTGQAVGSSKGPTADEVVTLQAPAAGTYSVCVTGVATPTAGVTYKLSSWVVGPASGAQSLRAAGPTNSFAGAVSSIAAAWSVAPGYRYLGNMTFIQQGGTPVGSTIISVDNH